MFTNQIKPLDLNLHGVRLPEIVLTEEDYKNAHCKANISNLEFLKQICKLGFERKISEGLIKEEDRLKYRDRFKIEIDVLVESGFIDYILLVWDIVNFGRQNKIPKGSARGSAAGSLILYLTGITDIDPLKYDLYFERFLSRARIKKNIVDGITYLDGSLVPDVDLDWSNYGRENIVEYLLNKYKGKSCKLSTYSTLTSKIIIKECGKIVCDLSEAKMNEVSGYIESVFGKVKELDESYKENEHFRQFCDQYPEVYKIAQKLHGLIKNKSSHASGYLISYDLLEDCIPVEYGSHGEIVSSYDMYDATEVAIKVDLLGLQDITLIYRTCESAGIDPLKIDVNDPFIYEQLRDLKTPHGLFQIGADCSYRVTQKVRPRDINDLAVVLSLARPGALAFVDKFSNYVNKGEYESVHPFFDETLKRTGGIAVFQEQGLKMVNQIGLSLVDAESIRRCLTGDTYFVSKQRGFISINTLLRTGYKNDDFLQLSPGGDESWGKIDEIWSNGIKQVTHVVADNGVKIKASMYHQFLTDKGWKARMRLNNDDYLVFARQIDYDGQDLISESLAIVIAGMITEGYFTSLHSCHFTNFDKELMDIFKFHYFNEFKIEAHHLQNNTNVAFVLRKFANKINKYLAYGKSASKFIPEIMMGMTKETTRKFLSFMLAAEGGISQADIENNRYFEFSSKSERLVRQIQLLLSRFGIFSRIRSKINPEHGTFWYCYLKEFSQLKKMYEELIVCWPSAKIKQIEDVLKQEREETNSFDLIPQSFVKKMGDQYPFSLSHESGRVYSKPVTRKCFKRFAAKTSDPYWVNFTEKKQYYSKFDNQKQDTREIEVFDFRMVDESKPYIIANGCVVHNCIGKKLRDELPLWEDKVKKTGEENNVPKEAVNKLWSILDSSKNYSFNASHAYSYSVLTAWSVYLKFKYPLDFFLELLKMAREKQDVSAEINLIQSELQYFNIKLLPPDLVKSQLDFSKEGNNLRFGLSAIKGISDKTVEALKSFLTSEKSNKFEVFQAAKKSGLSIGILSALIQSGCLQSLDSNRPAAVFAAQLFNLLTDREKIWCLKYGHLYNYSIFDILNKSNEILDDKGKKLFKDSRMETIKKKADPYREIFKVNNKYPKYAAYEYERRLLGFSYSAKLKDIFQEYSSFTLQQLINCDSILEGDNINVVGHVIEVEEKISKNKKKYCKIIIADETTSKQIMIFDPKLTEFKDDNLIPKEDDVVILNLRKWNDALIVNKLKLNQDKVYLKLAEMKE